MSNDQSRLDGTARDVFAVPFDPEGNMGELERIGAATTYQAAVLLARESGYRLAPEGEGFDCGHVANPDGPDAYGVSVLI